MGLASALAIFLPHRFRRGAFTCKMTNSSSEILRGKNLKTLNAFLRSRIAHQMIILSGALSRYVLRADLQGFTHTANAGISCKQIFTKKWKKLEHWVFMVWDHGAQVLGGKSAYKNCTNKTAFFTTHIRRRLSEIMGDMRYRKITMVHFGNTI